MKQSSVSFDSGGSIQSCIILIDVTWIRGRSRASIVGISRIQFSADDKLEFMKWAWKEQREVLRGWNLAREVHTLSFSFSPSSPPRIKKHPSPSQTGTNSFFLLFFTRCRLVSIMEIVHFHEIVLCPIYIYIYNILDRRLWLCFIISVKNQIKF